ncbi:MAG: NAD-dependent epimerase/dehydratase family protein [Bacillota bacterium]
MKILLIGGTGIISTAVSQRTIEQGYDLYMLNRGNQVDNIPKNTTLFKADINDEETVITQLEGHTFDVIVDFIAFTVEDIKRDIRLFKNKTKQYIFISTASCYDINKREKPIKETLPLDNKVWGYSQNKIACESYLSMIEDPPFEITIVRPSHTYDSTSVPFQLTSWSAPFTVIKRILNDQPIVIPNDGNNIWTLTYNDDFAHGFVDLYGNQDAYNQAVHITSDYTYTWNDLAKIVYKALNKTPNIIHIPLDKILTYFPDKKGPMQGDNTLNAHFDNTKIKALAPHYVSKTPYEAIVLDALQYYLNDPSNHAIDESFNKRYDNLIKDVLNK